MTCWYTSDLHIGHKLVAGLRGFLAPEDHDAVLAENWDRLVHPEDIVWVLGDIVCGGKAREHAALEWVRARRGVKHLIPGNHDSSHPRHRESHKAQARYLQVFASVQQTATRVIAGQRVLLSHFPYAGTPEGDHADADRFEQWRLTDHGLWLLHGHTHNPHQQVHGRQIHVGLDAHGLKPVAHRWIEQQIQATQHPTPEAA